MATALALLRAELAEAASGRSMATTLITLLATSASARTLPTIALGFRVGRCGLHIPGPAPSSLTMLPPLAGGPTREVSASVSDNLQAGYISSAQRVTPAPLEGPRFMRWNLAAA